MSTKTIEAAKIKIDEILIRPQVRKTPLTKKSISAMAKSLKEVGQEQPIVVRLLTDEEKKEANKDRETGTPIKKYLLTIGERRVRGATEAEWKEIDAVIRDTDDTKRRKSQLVENMSREDMNEMDTAEAFVELIEQDGESEKSIADSIGKDTMYVKQRVRLVKLLHPEVKKALRLRHIDFSSARDLCAFPKEVPEGSTDPTQLTILREAIEEESKLRAKDKEAEGKLLSLPLPMDAAKGGKGGAAPPALPGDDAGKGDKDAKGGKGGKPVLPGAEGEEAPQGDVRPRKKKEETQATHKTVKRVAKRQVAKAKDKQQKVPDTERLDNAAKKYIPAFIDADTKGAGLPKEGLDGKQTRALMKRFMGYLASEKVLILRG